MEQWLSRLHLHIQQSDLILWAQICVTVLILFITSKILLKVTINNLSVIASRTKTTLDDDFVRVLRSTRSFFLFFFACYLTLYHFRPRDDLDRLLQISSALIVTFQLGIWGNATLQIIVERFAERRSEKLSKASSETAKTLILLTGRILLITSLFLLALDNLGFNISTLLTGLGIGGVAVALAVQRVLGDVLASFSILLDRPFENGDVITVGEFTGTVEKIGLKTTRVRSVFGEQIVFPNSDLLASRIRNFKRINERRAVVSFNLSMDVDRKALQQIPDIVRDIFKQVRHGRLDRVHCVGYTDQGFKFEVAFISNTPEQAALLDLQQQFFFMLSEQLAARDIRMHGQSKG